MSLVSSMVRGYQGLRADVGGAPAPWDDYWYSPVGAPSVSGMRVSADSAKRLGTVVAVVSAKARALGVLPCFLFTDLAGGGKVIARQHPLFKILHSRPNDMQTAMEFYEMLQGHLELRGNGYAEILTSSRGVIGELMPMHPDHVKVEILSTGAVRYIYNDPLTRSTRTLLQEEVFHIREWADQPYIGQSRIAMGKDVLGVALAQQDYAGKYLKNDATSGLIITGTNFETKQLEQQYEKEFMASSTGENRHKIRMLPPGVEIKTLGVKPIEMQLLEASKASDVKICSLFNVLPHLVGVDAGKAATYASVEQFNLMHAQQCVLPMAVRWEQAIQRDLIDDDRFYAKFSLASLLRGDYATRMAGYALMIEHGMINDDEAREMEDMNPISGGLGKKYFRPLNWTTLDAAPVLPASTADNSGQGDDVENDDDNQPAAPGGNPDPAAQAGLKAQLFLLAQDASSRCVRREVGAVGKMIDQQAGSDAARTFYAEHFQYISKAFHLKPLGTLKAKKTCDERANHLGMLLDGEDFAEARAWIENIAVTESAVLTALAVEGVL